MSDAAAIARMRGATLEDCDMYAGNPQRLLVQLGKLVDENDYVLVSIRDDVIGKVTLIRKASGDRSLGSNKHFEITAPADGSGGEAFNDKRGSELATARAVDAVVRARGGTLDECTFSSSRPVSDGE